MDYTTKDGKKIDLTFAQQSEGFKLGVRAGKEAWGQEGGASRRNGRAFNLGWWVHQCSQDPGMHLPYTEKEIHEILKEDISERVTSTDGR